MTGNVKSSEAGDWSLEDYLNVIIRRLPIIAIIFLIVLAATTAYTVTRKARYQSGATFVIESADNQISSLFGRGYNYYLADQERVHQLKIYQALLSSRVFKKMLHNAVGQDSSLQGVPPPPEETLDAMNNLRLISSGEELVYLSTSAYDPSVAFRVAAMSLEVFRTRALEVKLEETNNVVDYIEKQKQLAMQKLEETERALQEFRKDTKINISSEDTGLLNRLMELDLQLTDIQTQRELAEANIEAYDQKLRELKVTDSSGLHDLNNPEAQRLQQELERLIQMKNDRINAGAASSDITALDRQIEAKKEQLFQRIINIEGTGQNAKLALEQTMANQIRENRIKEELNLYILKNRERYFRRLLESYRRENPGLIDSALEEARLKRTKTVYENLYNILLEKGEEARIKAATSTGGIRVIDEPTLPKYPIPINTTRNIVLGIILGLALGFGMALVVEFCDNTICSPADVEKKLQLPVIGSIPVIGSTNGSFIKSRLSLKTLRSAFRQTGFEVNENDYHYRLIDQLRPRDPITDHYRTLRTNMMFTSVDKPIKSILITSSLPGEGKTITTCNLGIIFADLGKRVLIVDADLRKPMQHSIFNLKRSPGLSDCLFKNSHVENTVHHTAQPNLSVLTCGTIPPNPAEMIASERMTGFLSDLEARFDLLLVDSPPVNIVTDPVLLASKLSHSILIVKFAATDWHMAKEATAHLRRANVQVLGVIINGIKIGRGYGYYYKYNYYYRHQYKDKKKTTV